MCLFHASGIHVRRMRRLTLKGQTMPVLFMRLKCVVYYANYRSWHQSSKIQVVP